MLVRWKAHRFMLGQSLAFFQDEFAGRVSQKVMQTSLAVRDSATKIMDVGVYIVVYFTGTVALLAASDLWFVRRWRCGSPAMSRFSSITCRASASSASSRRMRARR